MYRVMVVHKWPPTYYKLFPKGRPYTCWIYRRGRLWARYHKNISPSSAARLLRYVEIHMVETCRAHENTIQYETRI